MCSSVVIIRAFTPIVEGSITIKPSGDYGPPCKINNFFIMDLSIAGKTV